MPSSPHLSKLDDFREVVLLDTEYVSRDGNPAVPVCLRAHELRSGRRHAIFFDRPGITFENPLPMGEDVVYVAFSAQAESGVFLSLGWKPPSCVLDLGVEFRCVTNGLAKADGSPVDSSLIGALTYYGLDSMTVVEKKSMRDLILRGHPYSDDEQRLILGYCEQDVEALERLLPAMLPQIDIPYAIFRGRYTTAVAKMEFSGTPVDVPLLDRLRGRWDELKLRIATDIETEFGFGVYQGTHWSDQRFEHLLSRMGILEEWPRTPSGLLSTDDDDVFKPMVIRYPSLAPLRDLRSTLIRLNKLELPVGQDSRNRGSIAPYRSVTGRNYPPTSEFIFGKPTWIRALVKPEPGRALAYIDWSSAEFGIAAALSGDVRMKAAYESGDVYMAFAVEAGAAPRGANKDTHPDVRELYKTVVLAVQYGQTAFGLAKKLGQQPWQAQELLGLHRRVYARYWQWSEWMSQTATFAKSIETVFGWPMHVTSRTKPNTVSNFPMQANGAEMLRWACTFAAERGIEIHAPVQDALLVGGSLDEIEDVVATTQQSMAQASELVLEGFALRSDAKIVRYPDRYVDQRGVMMWNRVMKVLNELEYDRT
jgi:hypothetical protein